MLRVFKNRIWAHSGFCWCLYAVGGDLLLILRFWTGYWLHACLWFSDVFVWKRPGGKKRSSDHFLWWKNTEKWSGSYKYENIFQSVWTEDRTFLQRAHQTSLEGFKGSMAFLNKTKLQPLEKNVEVLDERIRLKDFIKNWKKVINLIEPTQTEIPQNKEAYIITWFGLILDSDWLEGVH